MEAAPTCPVLFSDGNLLFLIIYNLAKLYIIRNNMSTNTPKLPTAAADSLVELGKQIRAHRNALRVSAIAAAESAGISRVTLHRIERGEPSVNMGAYLNAMHALGMGLTVNARAKLGHDTTRADNKGWIPVSIDVNQYPQLKQLAWQLEGIHEIKPEEALGIYERNWRHIDPAALQPQERNLIDALREVFGDRQRDV